MMQKHDLQIHERKTGPAGPTRPNGRSRGPVRLPELRVPDTLDQFTLLFSAARQGRLPTGLTCRVLPGRAIISGIDANAEVARIEHEYDAATPALQWGMRAVLTAIDDAAWGNDL